MMYGRQLPETTHVVGPVGYSRSGDIQARGDLPLQRIPGGGDIGGPEYRCIALSACERRTRQNQGALTRVVAHATVYGRRFQKRIDVEVLRAGTDVVVA